MNPSPQAPPARDDPPPPQGRLDGPFVIERDGCPLHYWVAGDPSRPAVVLTHGFSMDHHLFDEQIEALARRWRVVVWDVRGHGKSQPLGDGFSIQRAAEDLLAILEREGISECALVGHSMGGYVAQELEFRQPWRVAALAMISSTCFTFRQPFALTMGAPFTVAALLMCPEELYHRQVGLVAGVRPQVQAYAQGASRAIPRHARATIWSGILDSYHFEPGHRLRCPLLLLDGEYDWFVAFGLIKLLIPRWMEREPGCIHRVIPDAGHNANQDNPAFTNGALIDFLERCFPRSARSHATAA